MVKSGPIIQAHLAEAIDTVRSLCLESAGLVTEVKASLRVASSSHGSYSALEVVLENLSSVEEVLNGWIKTRPIGVPEAQQREVPLG